MACILSAPPWVGRANFWTLIARPWRALQDGRKGHGLDLQWRRLPLDYRFIGPVTLPLVSFSSPYYRSPCSLTLILHRYYLPDGRL